MELKGIFLQKVKKQNKIHRNEVNPFHFVKLESVMQSKQCVCERVAKEAVFSRLKTRILEDTVEKSIL